MLHPALSTLTFAALLLASSFATALVTDNTGVVCEIEREAGYESGFEDGRDAGINEGFGQGKDAGIEQCFNDPLSCDISLGSCLAPAEFGETEPNDNIVSADQLVQATNFLGQSMGSNDEDWYYLITEAPNQNLTVNFSIPEPLNTTEPEGWNLTGWEISIRDARGNRLAGFDTDFVVVDDPAAGISYRVTLGLVGTYYLVVEPTDNNLSYHPYNIAAFLQDTELDTENYVVGFFDSEIEPNDVPAAANGLANGVSMFGLINLTFDQVVPSGEGFEYAQGEEDWYRYETKVKEIIGLTFCAHEPCSAGDWIVEVYDQAGADAWANGEDPQPLLAFNTSTAITEENPDPETFRFGLDPQLPEGAEEPAAYYMRVNHKRLFAAPCRGYAQDINNDGVVNDGDARDGEPRQCGCDSGYSCPVTIPNPDPSALCPDGSGEITEDEDTGAQSGPQQCDVTCRCISFGGTVELPEGDITSQYNFTWYGTNLPASTLDSPAYDAYEERPNPLAD